MRQSAESMPCCGSNSNLCTAPQLQPQLQSRDYTDADAGGGGAGRAVLACVLRAARNVCIIVIVV